MSGGLLAALSEVSRMRSQAACSRLIPRVSPFLKKRFSPLWRISYVTCHLSLINDICNDFCSKTVAFWLLPLRRVFFQSSRAIFRGSIPVTSHQRNSLPEWWSSRWWVRAGGVDAGASSRLASGPRVVSLAVCLQQQSCPVRADLGDAKRLIAPAS